MIRIITTKRLKQLISENERMKKELDSFMGQHENLHRLHKAVWNVKNGDIGERDKEIERLTRENRRLQGDNNRLRKKVKSLETKNTKGV